MMTSKEKEIERLKTDIRAALNSQTGVVTERAGKAETILRLSRLLVDEDPDTEQSPDETLPTASDIETMMRGYVEVAGEETILGGLFAAALKRIATADDIVQRYTPLMGADGELEQLFDAFLRKTGPLMYFVRSFADDEFGAKYLSDHVFEETPEMERASTDDYYFYTDSDEKEHIRFRTREEKAELRRIRDGISEASLQ